MRKDYFTEEALAAAQALAELKYSESEEERLAFAEAYDFTRCQRPDGSIYGIGAGKQCRQGSPAGKKPAADKPAKAKSSASQRNPAEDVRRPSGKVVGTSPRNMRIDRRDELVREFEAYKKRFGDSSDEKIQKIMKLYEQRIERANKAIDDANQQKRPSPWAKA